MTFKHIKFAASQNLSASFTKALKRGEIWQGMNYDEIPSTSTGTDGLWKDDEIDVDEKVHEENPYGDLYINEAHIPDIALKNLASIIEEKSKNEDDGFKKEYAVRYHNLNNRQRQYGLLLKFVISVVKTANLLITKNMV